MLRTETYLPHVGVHVVFAEGPWKVEVLKPIQIALQEARDWWDHSKLVGYEPPCPEMVRLARLEMKALDHVFPYLTRVSARPWHDRSA